MKNKQYIHDVKLIDTELIEPNEYNPNIMPEEKFKVLVKEIEEQGLLQPVLLRANGKCYTIIDGEHRWRAAVAAGYKQVPAIIVDHDLNESMIATINMNNLRGSFDSLKLAHVIVELNKSMDLQEIGTRLGMAEYELQGLLSIDVETPVNDNSIPDMSNNKMNTPQKYKFEAMFDEDDFEVVSAALEVAGGEDAAQSLLLICNTYLKRNV